MISRWNGGGLIMFKLKRILIALSLILSQTAKPVIFMAEVYRHINNGAEIVCLGDYHMDFLAKPSFLKQRAEIINIAKFNKALCIVEDMDDYHGKNNKISKNQKVQQLFINLALKYSKLIPGKNIYEFYLPNLSPLMNFQSNCKKSHVDCINAECRFEHSIGGSGRLSYRPVMIALRNEPVFKKVVDNVIKKYPALMTYTLSSTLGEIFRSMKKTISEINLYKKTDISQNISLQNMFPIIGTMGEIYDYYLNSNHANDRYVTLRDIEFIMDYHTNYSPKLYLQSIIIDEDKKKIFDFNCNLIEIRILHTIYDQMKKGARRFIIPTGADHTKKLKIGLIRMGFVPVKRFGIDSAYSNPIKIMRSPLNITKVFTSLNVFNCNGRAVALRKNAAIIAAAKKLAKAKKIALTNTKKPTVKKVLIKKKAAPKKIAKPAGKHIVKKH